MAKYDLSDAVALFAKNTANITALWTVYAITTFVAAGFNVSTRADVAINRDVLMLVVTAGFWCFALGHLTLLKQALSVNLSLSKDIIACIDNTPNEEVCQFKNSLQRLTTTANQLWPSVSIHLLINVFVTVTLWAPAIWR
jgi:hypothetical protein